MNWNFYGRRTELDTLGDVIARKRWFFARIQGRRRIGKTSLIQQALKACDVRAVYVQIPDSAPTGVISAFGDALETFEIPQTLTAAPRSFAELARSIETLIRAGFVVVLDEFQYFTRKHLFEFTSHLQAVVDRLTREAALVRGGLIVLGSIHSEMSALLEDRSAPLYLRTTHNLDLGHLDIASVCEILRVHADDDPRRLLFLWNLFEGVPKFYRDAYEQGVIAAPRKVLLEKLFFQSSSPLRTEADNWFLHELRGRYDVVLKYIARNPGCTNADLVAHMTQISAESPAEIGGYIRNLRDRLAMIERKLPAFAKPSAAKGRFYIRDNFLRTWLHALKSQSEAIHFKPAAELVAQSDERLADSEGQGLEGLVATLYEERSRKAIGFPLSSRIHGYWDRRNVELDLIAIDDDRKVLRIANCKRAPEKLVQSLKSYDEHIARFLEAIPAEVRSFRVEKVGISPVLDAKARRALKASGYLAEDLADLTRGLS